MPVYHPSLRRRLDSLRRRFPTAYWRVRNAVALGELWLARRRTQDDDRRDAYDEAFWDSHVDGDWRGLAALILRYCHASSIVDVGCGHGIVLDAFRQLDPALRLLGYDGSTVGRERARLRGLRVDSLDVVGLTKAEAVEVARHVSTFELALCLEVAEHIPPWHSGKLLTLLAGAPRLVFSAAHPNQGGHFHVNEQPASYWIDRLARHRFRLAAFDDRLRHELQALALPPWYKENIHVFEKGDG